MSNQVNMFADTNTDLPLFSGTPVRVTLPTTSSDAPAETQARMMTCGICLDTGIVRTRPGKRPVFCTCGAGKLERDRQLLEALPESKRLKRIRGNAPGAYPETSGNTDLLQVIRETSALDAVIRKPVLEDVDVLQVLLSQPDAVLPMRLIAQFGKLSAIQRASEHDLLDIPGMTTRRLHTLRAAFEMVRRAQLESRDEPAIIKSPSDIAAVLDDMRLLDQEQMRVIALNTKNRVLNIATIYQGSVHTTVIRVSELFADAIRRKASAVIIAHNHPSGDPSPSPEDVAVTQEIAKAGKILDIDVLDHIVMGNPGFVSLKERGLGF